MAARKCLFAVVCSALLPQALPPPGQAMGARVTFVGNAGHLIQVGKKKVLIDGLFRGYPGAYELPPEVQDALARAQPPFDDIDLILVTHAHGDHFDPDMVRQYLLRHPRTLFASGVQATAPFKDLPGRTFTFSATSGKWDRKVLSGIQVEATPLSHGETPAGEAEIQNLGYLVRVGDVVLFHTGDFDPAQMSFEAFRALKLPEKKVDIAFLQHDLLTEDKTLRRLVAEGVGAREILPNHYQFTEPPMDRADILRNYPHAVLFQKELQSWNMPVRRKAMVDRTHPSSDGSRGKPGRLNLPPLKEN